MAAPEGFRRVRALSARTHFVPGFGQVHFDPENSKDEVRFPSLPEDQIDLLVQRGWVADDVTTAPAAPEGKPAARRGGRRPAAPAAPEGDDDQAPSE